MSKNIMIMDTICSMLTTSRHAADKSQKYMADKLGVTVNTVQNWEYGSSCINVAYFLSWFDTLGINPLHYILSNIKPSMYNENTHRNASQARTALIDYFNCIATDEDILKLSFGIFSPTGSSWRAQLDMLTAINHLPLKHRVNIGQMVLDAYVMEKSENNLVLDDLAAPNIDNLQSAINLGRKSVLDGKKGYSQA